MRKAGEMERVEPAVASGIIAGAYLLGSIPFGVLAARTQGVDIAKVGSGNIGATNVGRTLGFSWGLLVLVLDVLKGFAPAMLAQSILTNHPKEYALAAGIAAMLGHCFSPFLGFRGGKGIATGLGALLGSAPLVAFYGLGVFAVAFALCKIVSLSSLIAAASFIPIGLALREPAPIIAAYVGLLAFAILRHWANIRRLVRRQEPKFDVPQPPKPARRETEPSAEELSEERDNTGGGEGGST